MLRRSLLALAILAAVGAPSQSGGPSSCCRHCGCHQMRKVCVPVKEIVKETTFEYSCKCEDFCVPGRSKCVGTTCQKDCQGCCHCTKVMQPTCGQVMTKTVLIKTPVIKEKCVTKWVVKTVCSGCGQACGAGSCVDGSCTQAGCTDCATPTDAVPTPPTPAVKQASAEAGLVPSTLFQLQ